MASRFNPTLFDKLAAGTVLDGGSETAAAGAALDRSNLRVYSAPRVERFNEAALRTTVLRELHWLLNTTNFAAAQSLDGCAAVASSVLNYGLGDLSGKLLHRQAIDDRAHEMRRAVQLFEPRIATDSVTVEPAQEDARPNVVSFIIRGDISAALAATDVEVRTDVEIDTGAVVLSGA